MKPDWIMVMNPVACFEGEVNNDGVEEEEEQKEVKNIYLGVGEERLTEQTMITVSDSLELQEEGEEDRKSLQFTNIDTSPFTQISPNKFPKFGPQTYEFYV